MADAIDQGTELVEGQKDETVTFDAEKCEEMLAQGKRNLLCGEVPQSVNQLQEVCRLLAAQYGETAPECADAYFQYGSALLELSRMESRVLGNALQGMTEDEESEETEKDTPDDGFTVPSDITDAEKEKISEEIIDAMLEPEETQAADQKSTENPEEKSTEDVERKSTENPAEKPAEDVEQKFTDMPEEKIAENAPDVDTANASAKEKETSEVEIVAEETSSAAETEAVAKQQSTTDELTVDEKGDAVKVDTGNSETAVKPADAAMETGAGDAEFKTITPGKAQRVPITTTEDEEAETKDTEAEESELADSDVENKLNPDEYEDDTTEFEQSEIAANDSQEEEVSNLQLAWEMLELAKNIYNKQEGADTKKREAECLKKLGEVGLESEQYSQSVEDFKSSLAVLKTCVADVTTDRSIAEMHYHIGVACVYAGRYDDGVTNFRSAITILEAKNAALQVVISAADVKEGSEESVEVTAARREMSDIAELIPEIKMKIEDAEEEKSSVHLRDVIKSGEAVTTIGFGDGESAAASSVMSEVKPVDDVTHLVRKKRKPEDTELAADDAKKPKTVDTEAVNTTDEPATVSDPSQADEPMATSEPTEEVRLDSEPAETPVVVNGCPETVQVNGDAEIKVKTVADCVAAVEEPVAME